MTSSLKWQREMLDYVAVLGVADAHIEEGGKHPAIVGTCAGRPFRCVIPTTALDSSRRRKNVQAVLKRTVRDLVDPPNLLQAG